ncbi:uncharacterized protein LOC132160320 [Carassius carassius]|uniref:uncharacterized protein LOC132160320 n=1 Tax=Carassius carassius TaxID=217509 RepID=UPI0028696A39|nr:uncharacterized protein LOC132160320 [Carassius carassius]
MMRSDTVIILFAFLIFGMLCHTDAVMSVSVLEGDPHFLSTDVCKQQHDTMRWYFNDILIALINNPITSCLYDGPDGRFRDRLEVDYETGSLNITNITTQHTGRYEAEIIRSESSGKSESLNRNPKCNSTKIYRKNINPEDIIKSFSLTVTASDFGKNKNEAQIVPEDEEKKIYSGLSSAAVAGIVVGVIAVLLLLTVVAAAGVSYYRRRSSRNTVKEKNYNKELLQNNEEVPKV